MGWMDGVPFPEGERHYLRNHTQDSRPPPGLLSG